MTASTTSIDGDRRRNEELRGGVARKDLMLSEIIAIKRKRNNAASENKNTLETGV